MITPAEILVGEKRFQMLSMNLIVETVAGFAGFSVILGQNSVSNTT